MSLVETSSNTNSTCSVSNIARKVTQQSIWEAFERIAPNFAAKDTWIEQELVLPEGLGASSTNVTALAALLSALVSTRGSVTLLTTFGNRSRNISLDVAKILAASDLAMMVSECADASGPNIVDIFTSDQRVLAPHDAAVEIITNGGCCTLRAREECFTEENVKHLCDLAGFAAQRLLDPSVAPPEKLLPARNEAKPSPRNSYVERFRHFARRQPDATAVQDDSHAETLCFADMWSASEALAARIQNFAPDGPRVALLLERGWQHLTTILATQKSGGTCILIDPEHPDDRIAAFLEECDTQIIVSAAATAPRAARFNVVTHIEIEGLATLLHEAGRCKAFKPEKQNETCFIAGTSGSTGKPKAVCLSYAGMDAAIEAIIDVAELGTGTSASWLSSPGYGMVEVDPIPVLAAGGTVHIPSVETAQDIRLLAAWYRSNIITHTLVMTSIAEALWSGTSELPLDTMLIAGERCKQWPPTHVNYKVFNVYGSAEAAVVSIEHVTGERTTTLPSVGRAVPGAHMYVVDADNHQVPANTIGELVITGETLSVGYLDPEQTAKAFCHNTIDSNSPLQYMTGDRARMRFDGTVEIFGRSDTMVKVRGHRVDITEIEIATLEVQGVAKAAVKCFDEKGGTTLVLFVEPSCETEDPRNAIRDHLEARLAPAAIPGRIVNRILPLGRNGKVNYACLDTPATTAPSVGSVFTPQTHLETVLRDAWLEWTQTKKATFEDNFFHCGGDSLRAMRMLGELAFNHGINVEMSAFVREPVLYTLIALARDSATVNFPRFTNQLDSVQAEPFELNESQQALWIGRGDGFEYGGVGCQGYFEWEVEDLNYNRFANAVDLVVERHPMLRMSINKQGLQQIGNYCGRDAVSYRDLSTREPVEVDNEINAIRDRMSNEEIGTGTWPLFNFEVSRIHDGKSRIHFVVDMLIADAWSIFQVILPDLIDFYFEDAVDLPELTTTFCDYVSFRREVTDTVRYAADRNYWIEKIKTLPAAPRLPQLDRSDSAGNESFERLAGTIEPAAWLRLQASAQARSISPSGVVGLALCEVLRSWSEADDFTLNFPVSDRMPVSSDIDNVVGDFTNTLLVPFDASCESTLAERGRHFQNSIWQALDHRLFTGVEVLRELSRVRRNGREPLMPVVLTSLLGHPGRHDIARLGYEVFGVSQTPQVTLDVQLRESNGTLYFKWDYLAGVIRPDVISDMFGAFQKLLDQLSVDETLWENVRFDLRPQEQIASRALANDTTAPVPLASLRELLLSRIAVDESAPAITDTEGSYTWGETGQAAARISAMVEETREPWQRHVGILLPKSATQYAAVYGCLLSGVGYVPIDVESPDERIMSVLQQAGTDVVITTPGTIVPKNLRRIDVEMATLLAMASDAEPTVLCDIPEDYAPYVIFTSGSTGKPKGVEIPECAVLNHAHDVVDRFGLDAETKHLASAALHFDMSVFDVFGPLVHGGSVVLTDNTVGPDPDAWLALHREHLTTFWACVPAIMDLVCSVAELETPVAPVPSLRNIVMAGDFIPLTLLPRTRALFPKACLYSCGGPTETTNWSIIHEIDEAEGSLINSVIYGKAMRNSAYHIVGPDWSDRPDWVPGEMVVESDVSLAKGYIGRDDLTNAAFTEHPRRATRMYHTGDLGRYLPNGEIEILGRIDNQIKINGLRIELGEIEQVAGGCLGVERVCAFTIPDKEGRPKQIALAFIGEASSASGIETAMKQKLPHYMIPKFIQHHARLPLSRNGKVDVKSLRKEVKLKMASKTPETQKAVMREVIKAVATRLSQSIVLPDDNFFELGGDSLSAMKIKIDLDAHFCSDVALEDIMLTDTIGELAGKMQIGASS